MLLIKRNKHFIRVEMNVMRMSVCNAVERMIFGVTAVRKTKERLYLVLPFLIGVQHQILYMNQHGPFLLEA